MNNSITELHDYDVAMHLRTREEMAAYLEAAIVESEGDAAFIAVALGDIVRAKCMAELARETGLGRNGSEYSVLLIVCLLCVGLQHVKSRNEP